MTSARSLPGRRVVTGLDDHGRSTVISDEQSRPRFDAPHFSVVSLWSATVPAAADQGDGLGTTFELLPPTGGLHVLMSVIPPDREWLAGSDPAADYGSSMGALAPGVDSSSADPLMHKTGSVDTVTVVSGQLIAVLETDEVVLEVGDTIVQRATMHKWSNRGDAPAVFVITMWDASAT